MVQYLWKEHILYILEMNSKLRNPTINVASTPTKFFDQVNWFYGIYNDNIVQYMPWEHTLALILDCIIYSVLENLYIITQLEEAYVFLQDM